MLTLGLVQAAADASAIENLDTVRQFVSLAKERGCAVLCFPEAFLTGYAPEAAEVRALRADSDIVREVSALAQTQRMDLLVGFMERADDRVFLTHGVFGADGGVGLYRKTHLGERERTVFSAGDELPVFHLSCGLRAGIQLCVESHFPEITQTYSLRGAEIVFAPHAVPMPAEKRRRIWEKLMPARSYDDRVYMACCNQWDGQRYGGGCMVADPQGEIMAACFEDNPALLCFTVDREAIQQYHRQNADRKHRYYPELRRPELYEG